MTPEKAYKEACRRIAEESREQTGRLELCLESLSEIPVEIRNLPSLTTLDCSSTQVSDLSPLAGLTCLTTLNCSKTQVSDLSPLAGLTSLSVLDCSQTAVSDLSPLKGLASLAELNCEETRVTVLSPLAELKSLRKLNCLLTQVSDLSPLATLSSLTSLTCSSTHVTDLSPLAGLTRLSELDCSILGIFALSPLAGLMSLRVLDCSQTAVSDLSPLKGLANLSELSFSDTEVSDLSSLAEMTNLTKLDFSETAVFDLSPLAGLTNLTELSFSETDAFDLLPLAGLTNLKTLIFSETDVADLSPLASLTRLKCLVCSETQVADLSPMASLTSLTKLDCSQSHVADLSPLVGLTSLIMLNCWGTRVSDLSPLTGLRSLTSLDCLGTRVSDLSPLTELKSLTFLDCSRTRVSDLSPLTGLESLMSLIAGGCALHLVARSLLSNNSGLKLYLYEAIVSGVPAEVLSQSFLDDCRQRLLDHYNDLDGGADRITEVKVIVLGNGRIGKTQICNRLRGQPFVENADSTHGILIEQADLQMADDERPANLNLWDFGGQDIYHGTHSLFLKSRCVFVVVWTPQTENDQEYEFDGMTFRNQPLRYWLEYVRAHAGAKCPVVLVQNQCDTPHDEATSPPVSQEKLHGFPYLQQVHYSAKNNRRRASLDDALQEAIRHLRQDEGETQLGRGRLAVRQRLQTWFEEDTKRSPEQRQHRTIAINQFKELCQEVGGVSSPESLLHYLHHCGVLFYESGLFRSDIILDQSWALEAIYTVFNRKQCYQPLRQLQGRFTRSLLETLAWHQDKYCVRDQERFLAMMLSCDICFVHREGDEKRGIETEYTAPDLLPERSEIAHQLAGRWREGLASDSLSWRFDFLSHTLIRTIIAKVGSRAGDMAVYWKTGVWFYDARTGSEAIVEKSSGGGEQQPYGGAISVTTKGGQCCELLRLIHEMIAHDLEQAGGIADRQLEPGYDHDQAGISSGYHGEFAKDDNASTPAVIKYEDPPRQADEQRCWVSHAWKDERCADSPHAGKVRRLCDEARRHGFRIGQDIDVLQPYDDLRGFMRRLSGGDLIFVILSDAYLKSPNCMYELLTIWQRAAMNWEEARAHVRVFVLPETKVFSIQDRLRYAGQWQATEREIKQLIDTHGVTALGETDLRGYKLIKEFVSNVGELLAQISKGSFFQSRTFPRPAS
jgi:internalin A